MPPFFMSETIALTSNGRIIAATNGTDDYCTRLAPMAQPNQKQILIVEDEPMVRMVAADALADRGIIAWEAGDAEEAL